jgi:hypothetical protein
MSAINSNCYIFAGPTLVGLAASAAAAGVKVLPPAKRGDIAHLISRRKCGVIAIVDGQFHQCLSVGHAEIRSAIDTGWQVWGLSSMGAIRACEMRHLGVLGFGQVYDWFCRDENFRDDEVALMHQSSPPYVAFSEPLIHIRLWLRELRRIHLLASRQEKRLLDKLMSMWFGERTLHRVRAMVLDSIQAQRDEVDETLANFERFRVKCHDLYAFLEVQPWTKHAKSSLG